MSTTQLRFPQRQKPLLQAVMETKPDSLMEKIKIAETAIAQRLRELERSFDSEARRVSTSLRPVVMEFSEFFHLC